MFSQMTQNEFFILQGGRMSRSGLRQLMTTQQMKMQASYLAEYEQVGTPGYKAASNTNTKIKKNEEKAEMNGL